MRSTFFLFSLLCFFISTKIFAEDTEYTVQLESTSENTSTEKPLKQLLPDALYPPSDAEFDWIQLTSNELLKGEIKALYEEVIEFESDELDTLFLDWEDIRTLQSASYVSIGFKGRITRTGKLVVHNDKAFINGQEFDREDILTIISGEKSERSYWSGKITIGVKLQDGNTKQTDFNTIAKSARRTTLTRFTLDYVGNYSQNESTTLTNNHRTSVNYDWFLSERFYIRPFFGEVLNDTFQNIDSRVTAGIGLGYNIIDTSKIEWRVGGGPAYKVTRYDNVVETQEQTSRSAAVSLDTNYEIEITKDIDFNFSYDMQFSNEDFGNYTHHTITGLSIELTDIFDLDLTLIWDKTQNPSPNGDQIVPLENDYQFVIGIGVDL